MIALTDMVIDRRCEDDLCWRFNGEADAEMGLRSNLGGIVALIERGVSNAGGADPDADGRAVAAASRARRIDLALHTAGVVHGQRVQRLARLHYGTPPPPWALGGCGPTGSTPHLTPLLELLPEALEAHQRSRSRMSLQDWLRRLGSKLALGTASAQDRAMGAQLRRAGEGAVADVVHAYARARRLLPREAPRDRMPSLPELLGLHAR